MTQALITAAAITSALVVASVWATVGPERSAGGADGGKHLVRLDARDVQPEHARSSRRSRQTRHGSVRAPRSPAPTPRRDRPHALFRGQPTSLRMPLGPDATNANSRRCAVRIVGRVIGASEAMPGVTVRADFSRTGRTPWSGPGACSAAESSHRVTPDSAGRFEIRLPVNGSWYVEVSTGNGDGTLRRLVCTGATDIEDAARALDLGDLRIPG